MDTDANPDRRKESRRKLKLQKIFAAEFLDSENANCFLHIYDLSLQGMRVHTDHIFPESGAIPIRLYLDQPVELRVAQVWRKELFGGMQVVGLSFNAASPEALDEIQRFMERYSPENKRTTYRLQRILVVEMLLGSTSQKFGVFTLDISATGMRISHDFPLPEEVDIPFRILLEYDRDPIEVTAVVSWQEENTLGQYMIGLHFCHIGEEAIQRIEDFIEFHRSGPDTKNQAFAPLAGFDDSV